MLKKQTEKKRVFEGVLYSPSDTGKTSWIAEDPADATKESDDEAWFGWAEKKKVRITVERI